MTPRISKITWNIIFKRVAPSYRRPPYHRAVSKIVSNVRRTHRHRLVRGRLGFSWESACKNVTQHNHTLHPDLVRYGANTRNIVKDWWLSNTVAWDNMGNVTARRSEPFTKPMKKSSCWNSTREGQLCSRFQLTCCGFWLVRRPAM